MVSHSRNHPDVSDAPTGNDQMIVGHAANPPVVAFEFKAIVWKIDFLDCLGSAKN